MSSRSGGIVFKLTISIMVFMISMPKEIYCVPKSEEHVKALGKNDRWGKNTEQGQSFNPFLGIISRLKSSNMFDEITHRKTVEHLKNEVVNSKQTKTLTNAIDTLSPGIAASKVTRVLSHLFQDTSQHIINPDTDIYRPVASPEKAFLRIKRSDTQQSEQFDINKEDIDLNDNIHHHLWLIIVGAVVFVVAGIINIVCLCAPCTAKRQTSEGQWVKDDLSPFYMVASGYDNLGYGGGNTVDANDQRSVASSSDCIAMETIHRKEMDV